MRDSLVNTDSNADNYATINQEYVNASEKYESNKLAIVELELQLSENDNNVTLAYDSYANVEREANRLIQDAQDAIDAQKYELNSISQSDIDALKTQIDNCIIKASKSGTITSLNVSEGVIPTSETLITTVDTSNYYISAKLSETNISKIEEEMSAVIKTIATGDEELEGKISKISNVANPSVENEDNNFSVKINITDENKFDKVYIGMASSVKIILNETSDVYAVPYDSIIKEDKKKYILVAQPSGKAYEVKKFKLKLVLKQITLQKYLEMN